MKSIKNVEEILDFRFDPAEVQKAVDMVPDLYDRLKTEGYPNFIGIGVGPCFRNGHAQEKICFQIHVKEKVDKNVLSAEEIFPSELNGIETDVLESGEIELCANTAKIRPVQSGYSIGVDVDESAGTLGAFVTDNKNKDALGVLSNNHVLAENGKFPIGTNVVQPGPYDQKKSEKDFVIGKLTRYVPLSTDKTVKNKVDAAFATLTDAKDGAGTRPYSLTPTNPTVPMKVQKSGRTTGTTDGVIFTVGYSATDSSFEFVDLVLATYFSAGGDSGSLVTKAADKAADRKPVGLHKGKITKDGKVYAVFCPISTVLTELDVNLA